ncbi:hypothetical protein SKAU_G00333930 [Synaphobranchus kaupii]|uniref:Cyclin-dependent kinase inhibitor 3 n=1 Tax=Synaphobranchus kaupii TaxID=118154 RepID=A0A9Q1IIJ2_SYNKA|nr:hypothetical protein SKAU_G00333930 [Synaphobranchus kaupii]
MVYLPDAMKTTEFDSSDEEVGEEEQQQQPPLEISWLPLTVVECSQFLGICALPGCRYKDIRRNLQRDMGELQNQGVQDVFVFYGGVPELEQCCQILEELQLSIHDNRKTVVHCYGGLGRSALIAACLLLKLSVTMTPGKAIDILRQLRGGGAIQTVKQYNFLHEFREKYAAHQESKDVPLERSLSR